MINRKSLLPFIVGLLLLSASCSEAWAQRVYVSSARKSMVTNSVSVHLKPLYMFSDMDIFKYAFRDPQYMKDIGLGGLVEVAYSVPFSKYALVRTSVCAGYVRGDASIRCSSAKGPYNGGFGEAAVGLEYYPFVKKGLYIYGGLGLNLNSVTLFPERQERRSFHVLPIVPLEVGYKFGVRNGWYVGAAVSGHIGLMDSPNCNMDDYGDLLNRIHPESYFPDGYVSFSLLVAYHWGESRGKYDRICNCVKWQ